MTKLEQIDSLPPWEWPPDARLIFLKALVDRSTPASDRLIAAELGGDMVVINDDLALLLASIAADASEPEGLRARAAVSLGPILDHTEMFEFDEPDDIYISEATFQHLRDTLRELYFDTTNPKLLRRRVLEVGVRAPEEWLNAPIAEAYASGDDDWMLTAVFCMQYVTGFDRQVLESLNSPDEFIHEYAVAAAGRARIEAAWPHIEGLLSRPGAPKDILLAAITAATEIRPQAAIELLQEYADSEDEDIAEAAQEAIQMAEFELEDEAGFGEDDELDEDIEPGGWRH